MTPNILKLADQLATAEHAFARMQETGPRRAGAPMRAEPKCERNCAVCWLKCAIIHSCVETIRQDLETAIADQRPVMTRRGKFYVASVGRA